MKNINYLESMTTVTVSLPLLRPFVNHLRTITTINGVVVRITTGDGITGCGFVYGLAGSLYQEVAALVQNELQPFLIASSTKAHNAATLFATWQSYWQQQQLTASQQQRYALAAVDIAIWDIMLKAKQVSLHSYLGGYQEKIPVYSTTGWLSLNHDQLLAECQHYAKLGVNAFKIRLGHADDYQRVKLLRDSMGDDFILICDANQRYSVDEAAAISKKLLPLNIRWLEEPTSNDMTELVAIKKLSALPIALGESFSAESDFQQVIQQQLTDYLQPDLPRCAGISGFCKVAELALARKLPLCNHFMHELSTSLIAAYPNGDMLEYDQFLPPGVLTHDFSVEIGCIKPPNLPGVGVELTAEALKAFSDK